MNLFDFLLKSLDQLIMSRLAVLGKLLHLLELLMEFVFDVLAILFRNDQKVALLICFGRGVSLISNFISENIYVTKIAAHDISYKWNVVFVVKF
jgi:hypothetical protein